MKQRIGIISATPDELAPFLEPLENRQESEYSGLRVYTGTLSGKSVAMTVSGVCKVNAAVGAMTLAENAGVTHMVFSGVAGGIDPALKVFDTVVSSYCAYHDVLPLFLKDYPPYFDGVSFPSDGRLIACCKLAQDRSDFKDSVFFGGVVTGEAFIEQDGRSSIIERFKPLCVDMESAAAAHVCKLRGIPFIAVRSLSDTDEESGIDAFIENCRRGARKSFALVSAMLEYI